MTPIGQGPGLLQVEAVGAGMHTGEDHLRLPSFTSCRTSASTAGRAADLLA